MEPKWSLPRNFEAWFIFPSSVCVKHVGKENHQIIKAFPRPNPSTQYVLVWDKDESQYFYEHFVYDEVSEFNI